MQRHKVMPAKSVLQITVCVCVAHVGTLGAAILRQVTRVRIQKKPGTR